jgi:hypothetical protein
VPARVCNPAVIGRIRTTAPIAATPSARLLPIVDPW